MNAQQFLAEFGNIANAPGGVARLRELVLRLAIQGRLVPQDDLDKPAEDFLTRALDQAPPVARLRFRTPTAASIKRTTNLPSGWAFTSLDRLANPQAGFAFKANLFNQNGIGLPIIRVRDVGFNAPATYFSGEYRDEFLVARGDWLVAMDGDFRVAVWEAETALLNQRVTRLRFYSSEINKKYVCIALQFELRKLQGVKNYTTVDHLSGSQIAESEIALPPLEEQSRIVAKVDELMALCDQLEKQQQERRKLQNALRQSTLQALASAQSPHELRMGWERLQANFGRLLSEVDDVKDVRRLILDLAFVGRLSSAQAGDEDVAHFLKRTRNAKAQRLATGEMKRKTSTATDVVQLDVDLPVHWSKASLDELFQFIDYRGKTPTKTDSGVVLVTAKNVRPGRLEQEPIEYISEKSYAEWMTRGFPKVGDILFTTEAPLGNVALIEVPPSFALAQRVIDLQPFADLNTRCAMYFMMSPVFQAVLDRNSSGMTAKGIKAAKLKQLELPVPSVAEQTRIVARVDQLMQICDDMENRLRDAQKTASRLAVASVSAFTGVASEQDEDTAVKVPQTELIAPLRLATPPDVKAPAPLATILARHQGEMAARDLWQRFGGEIDGFYAQLKTEVTHGWIAEPEPAQVREKPTAEPAKA